MASRTTWQRLAHIASTGREIGAATNSVPEIGAGVHLFTCLEIGACKRAGTCKRS